MLLRVAFFFFFQAEDGIRDLTVTGVQTCALPICPALGGTRFWNYETDREALIDCLRLARGMTYKAAVAGLNLGGGKAVIIGDNKIRNREAIFRAHGRHVKALGGRYITAEDVGTSVNDMEV